MDRVDKADKYLRQVFEIIAARLREYPVRVYLFGSRAAGAARSSSDCDIGIEPVQDLPAGLLSRLREELEESHVPCVVEVIDLSQADEEFAQKVRNEGVLCIDTSSG